MGWNHQLVGQLNLLNIDADYKAGGGQVFLPRFFLFAVCPLKAYQEVET